MMCHQQQRTSIEKSCLRSAFLFYTFFVWLSGIILFCFAVWVLIDPARNYVLDLVDFSEDEPLLKFGAYAMLATSCFPFFIGLVGCIGSMKMERFLLSSFIFFTVIVLLSKIGIISLAVSYKNKFPDSQSMTTYLANISQNRYSRDRWAFPVMNHIQYYKKCCGGEGPLDYQNSFWFLTNTERGSRSFVPWSCCRQTQYGRPWALQPIDAMCITYTYGSRAFNDSVHTQGCGLATKEYVDKIAQEFIAVCLVTSLFDIVGIVLATTFLCKIVGQYRFMEF